jgi:hypothetical protein
VDADASVLRQLIGTSGIRHVVEVEAGSLYEAAMKAIAMFRADPWMEQLGTATPLDIEIRESTDLTRHSVTLKQVESWLVSASTGPHAASKKTRLKMMLMRRKGACSIETRGPSELANALQTTTAAKHD